MKDALLRRIIRDENRTTDVWVYGTAIYQPARTSPILDGLGSCWVDQSSVREDGSMIAFTQQREVYLISKSKSGYTWRALEFEQKFYPCSIVRVGDNRAIFAERDGTITSLLFGDPLIFEKKKWNFKPSWIVSTSKTEFVVGDFKGVLRFFHHKDGRSVQLNRTVPGYHSRTINRLVVHGNVMVAISPCRYASVWDLTAKRCVAMLPQSTYPVHANLNDHHIITVTYDEVRVFKNEPGYRLRYVLKGLNGLDRTICAFAVGDHLLLTAGDGSNITLTNLETKCPIARFSTHLSRITNLTLAPDGLLIASCIGFKSPSSADWYTVNFTDYDYCILLKLSRNRKLSNKLKEEAQNRLGIRSKQKNCLITLVAAVTGAVVIYAAQKKVRSSLTDRISAT